MPYTYGYGDVGTNVAQGVTDAGKIIGGLAKRAYCSIYKNFPGRLVPTGEVPGLTVRVIMDSWCFEDDPANLPDPPSVDFEGGQCDALYKVECLWSGSRKVEVNNVLGPIQAVECVKLSNIYHEVRVTDVNGNLQVQGNNISGSPPPVTSRLSLMNGNSDNCGSIPPEYPPTPPLTDNDVTFDYDITLNDGSIINIPVTIDIDSDGNAFFPITIDVGGVNVAIDVGGITIGSNNTNNDFGGGGGGGLGTQNDNPDEVPPPSLDPEDLEEEESTEEQAEEETGIDGLLFVEIDITSIPVNNKAQFGNGAPDIYYAGWLEFSRQGKYFPRQPIDFLGSIFEAPLDADGYAFTMKAGYTAKATVIRRKPEEPPETGGSPIPV